jgi:hypothetical protein
MSVNWPLNNKTPSMSFIQHVTVSDKTPLTGQSILVEVTTTHPETEVNINGVPGISRFIQFAAAGNYNVIIGTRHKGQTQQYVEKIIVRKPGAHDPIYPILMANMYPYRPRTVIFSIANATPVLTDVLYYNFDFGDGHHGQTENGFVMHDYSDALVRDELFSSFTVRVDGLHRDGSTTSAIGTATLYNVYAYNKITNRLLTPYVDANQYPAQLNGQVDCTFTLSNLEDEDILFTDEKHELLIAEKQEPADRDRFTLHRFQNTNDPILRSLTASRVNAGGLRLPARSQITITRTFPWSQFKGTTFGIAIHLAGTAACSKLKARASAYIEVKLPLQWSTAVVDSATSTLLTQLSRVNSSKVISHDHLYDIIHRNTQDTSNKIAEHQRLTSQALANAPADRISEPTYGAQKKGAAFDLVREPRPNAPFVISESSIASAITTSVNSKQRLYHIEDQPNIGLGCDPDNLPDNLPDGTVCQFTGRYEWRLVPGRLLKAKKGDLLVDPGGSGIIGQLLQQLSQVFSHCGIMTKNHIEVRHATASEDWLFKHHLAGTSLGHHGSDGFDPVAVKYVWPGTLTQSIDQATHGQYVTAPEGDAFNISDFSFKPAALSNRVIVNPLVIKPNPFLDTSQVRLKLHAIADQALAINGHYRFYGYTKPEIALDPSGTAGSDAGWANGTVAVVCSSFIWLAAQKAGIKLEGPANLTTAGDLETKDTDKFAAVSNNTLDGLYFYSEDQRKVAATWLHNAVYNQALEKSGAIGKALTDAPDDFADQVCNTFAFDWSDGDSKNSNNWEHPGAGNAVSPDNLLFWDGPDNAANNAFHSVYGSTEEAIYIAGAWAQVPIFVWTHVETKGSLIGTVRSDGDITGATVSLLGSGKNDVTVDGSGRYRFDDVPAGSYNLAAELIANGVPYHPDPVTVTIVAAQTITADLFISIIPPWLLRSVTIDIFMETNWSSVFAHGVPGFADSKTVLLNPIGAPTAHLEFEGDYGNPHGKLMFDITLKDGGDIALVVTAQEIDDEVEATINGVMDIPRDTWKSWGCTVANDDPIDNDWTKMSWKVQNAQT